MTYAGTIKFNKEGLYSLDIIIKELDIRNRVNDSLRKSKRNLKR